MGQVRLKSSSYFARVVVRAGNQLNAEDNPQVFDGAVAPGFEQTYAEGARVCYRRSGNPGDATSPLGSWSCDAYTLEGVEDFFIS